MSIPKTTFPETLSHWEIQQYFSNVELVVVGSGIVGLTTAIFYKKRYPARKVVVLERGFLPSGASTKNAGFACFGSISEILSDLNHSSEDEVFALIAKRVNGLKALRELVGDQPMDYEPCGGYEIFRKQDGPLFERCMSFIPEINTRLKRELKLSETYIVNNNAIHDFGFQGISTVIFNQHEGSIDTGKMMAQLVRLAVSLGITILNGLEVESWDDEKNGVRICLKGMFELTARKMHITTNGFAKKLLPTLDIEPARAQVLITAPIPNLRVKGTFHLDEGFYYFRNVGNRLLLGGGRNLDFDGENTSEITTTELIQQKLEALLSTCILPQTPHKIEHRWAGVMGVGNEKRTIIQHVSDNVSCAVRLGGMGVAIGTAVGKESVSLIG